jgi:hypothetical protein
MNTNTYVNAEIAQFVDTVRQYCEFADFLIDTAGFEPEVCDFLLMDVLKPLHEGVRKIIWRMGPAMAYAQITADDGQTIAAILDTLADMDADIDPDDQFETLANTFRLTDRDLIHHLMRVHDGVASLMN